MMNEADFIMNMMHMGDYGRKIVEKYNTLSDVQKASCLDNDRLKHICTDIELMWEENAFPKFRADVDYATQVINECDAFGEVHAEVWNSLSTEAQLHILDAAEHGYPMKREGNEIWHNVMGILYSVMMMMGDEDGE